MKSSRELSELLVQLKLTALAPDFSKDSLIFALESLLLWLNNSQNNTDSNCKEIDYFISFEILPEKRFEDIPENIRNILFDMGATLHDAHTSPELARNFESMPNQLLNRLRGL